MTSLRHKLTLPVLLVVIIMVSFHSWFVYERFEDEIRNQYLLRGILLVKSMTYTLENEQHIDNLIRIIHSYAAETDVQSIVIIAGSPQKVIAASRNAWMGRSVDELPEDLRSHAESIVAEKGELSHIHKGLEDNFHIGRPVVLFSQHNSKYATPAVLLIHVQVNTIQNEFANIKHTLIGTLLLLATLSMFFIWLLLRQTVFIPVQALVTAMTKRAKGDTNAFAPVHSQDEIGQMASTYNDMLNALANNEAVILAEKDRAEQLLDTLQDSEEQFRSSFENAPFGMCLVGLDKKIIEANNAFCRLANVQHTDLPGRDFFEMVCWEKDGQLFPQNLEETSYSSATIEMRFCNPTGACQWMETGFSLVRDAKGNMRFFILQIQDVTSRKCAEAEILHRMEVEKAVSLTSQELVSRRHPVHTMALSALAQAIGADRACIFKISPSDGLPRVLGNWTHPNTPSCQCHKKEDEQYEWLLSHFESGHFGGGVMINNVYDLPETRKEKTFLLDRGVIGWICLPIRYSKGALRGFIAFDRVVTSSPWREEDISALQVAADLLGGHWERLETEEEKLTIQERAMRTSHLASLGMLSAGVAHEINNPNNLIMFNAPLLGKFWEGVIPILQEKRQQDGDFTLGGLPVDQVVNHIPRLVTGIQSGAQRIQHIVAQLKRLVKSGQGGREVAVDLEKLIQDAISIITPQIHKRSCILHLNMEENLPRVRGSVQELEQVFLNIIINAMESLDQPNRNIWVQVTNQSSQQQVVVSVRDEGVGIPKEMLQKVMEPLFTTKGENGGTGLGLAISKGILDKYGGRLDLASQPNEGTTVKIVLRFF